MFHVYPVNHFWDSSSFPVISMTHMQAGCIRNDSSLDLFCHFFVAVQYEIYVMLFISMSDSSLVSIQWWHSCWEGFSDQSWQVFSVLWEKKKEIIDGNMQQSWRNIYKIDYGNEKMDQNWRFDRSNSLLGESLLADKVKSSRNLEKSIFITGYCNISTFALKWFTEVFAPLDLFCHVTTTNFSQKKKTWQYLTKLVLILFLFFYAVWLRLRCIVQAYLNFFLKM